MFWLSCSRTVVVPSVSGSTALTPGGGGGRGDCSGVGPSPSTPRFTGEVVVPFAVSLWMADWLAGGCCAGYRGTAPRDLHAGYARDAVVLGETLREHGEAGFEQVGDGEDRFG